jgi:hypothetical protein
VLPELAIKDIVERTADVLIVLHIIIIIIIQGLNYLATSVLIKTNINLIISFDYTCMDIKK